MTKPATIRTGHATWGDLKKRSAPKTDTVPLDEGVTVLVRELDGDERFKALEIAEKESDWEMLKWSICQAMIEPEAPSVAEVNDLHPDFITAIGRRIMELSGLAGDERVAADVEKKSAG